MARKATGADEMFQTHIEGAKAAGIKVGIYFYSQAISYEEGVEEAQFALNLASAYTLDMPVVIDTEEVYADGARTADLSNDARTDSVVGFCETVKSAGYTPMDLFEPNWFVREAGYDKTGDISCGWHIMRISRISHICILAGSIQELARSQESDRNWI